MLNLDAILDTSMEEVQEAPNYVVPENGIYVLRVANTEAKTNKSKEEGKEDYVTLHHEYEILEVVEQEGLPIAPGSLFGDRWMFQEKGLEYFKTRTLDIAEANGEDRTEIGRLKLSEMLQGVKDMTFKCVIAKSPRSDDPTRFNTRISNICKAE